MPVKHVSVTDAYDLQQREAYDYVDVRSIPEFDNGHPAGAINIPLLHADPRTGGMVPNQDFVAVMQANFAPDAKLLIGCQVGARSARAVELLQAHGFTNAVNVAGGYGGSRDPMTGHPGDPGWVSSGLPVEAETPPGHGYEDVKGRPR